MVPGVRLTEITAQNGLLKGLGLISFSLLEQGIDPDCDCFSVTVRSPPIEWVHERLQRCVSGTSAGSRRQCWQ